MATFTSVAGRDSLTELPRDIFGQIFSYLSTDDAENFSVVNKKAREIFSDEVVQEELIRTSFGERAVRARPHFMLFSEYYQRLRMANGIHARGILKETLRGDVKNISCIQIIEDGKRALSWDHALKLWDLETGACIRTFTGQYTGLMRDLQISPDSTKVFGKFFDGSLAIWNLETGTYRYLLTEPSDRHLAIRADGATSITASVSGIINLYDLESGGRIREFRGHAGRVSFVALNANKDKMLSVSTDNTLRLWNFETGACIHIFSGHKNLIDRLQIYPDWTKALSGSADDIFRLWDLETGECIREFTGFCQFELNADCTKVLSSRPRDGTLRLLDFDKFQTDKCIQEFRGRHLGVIEDLKVNARWTRALTRARDGTRLWDLKTGVSIPFIELSRLHVSSDWTKAFSRNTKDNDVSFWDLRSGRCLQTLSGPIKFLPNMTDRCLMPVSVGTNCLKIWNFSSLPLEQISEVVRAFLQKEPNAQQSFKQLVPSFVFLKTLRDREFVGLTEEETPNFLCDYIKKFFLVDVIELFKRAEAIKSVETKNDPNIVSKSELFHRSAFMRFGALPDPIKGRVYEALRQIHLISTKSSERVPENYGEIAFQSEETSDETRIEAIRNVMVERI